MIRIGTRSSRLARAQTRTVLDQLHDHGHEATPVPLETLGDEDQHVPVHQMGTAGAFTTGLTAALLDERIDLAVHSLKDLPIEPHPGTTLPAILPRGAPQDVLLVRPPAHDPREGLPLEENARVATSGPRRQSQLLHARPDLTIVNVRGNVDTRIQKLRDGWFDALTTARVAVDRMQLPLNDLILHDLDPSRFPPAPGQAAIAIQAREDTAPARIAKGLDHARTREAVRAERRLLDELGGGCGLPLGAYARKHEGDWALTATYAGRGWTPADRPRLQRERDDGADPARLASSLLDPFRSIQATPRRDPTPADPPEDPAGLVIASQPTAHAWSKKLQEAGHPTVPVPTRRFTPGDPPDDATLDALHRADWIAVTSRQAVMPLTLAFHGDPPQAYIAAVGPATARALQREGFPCHLVPPEPTGDSLVETIHDLAHEDDRVLLAQSDTTHGDARKRLDGGPLHLDTWQAYRTHEEEAAFEAIPLELPARFAIVMSPRNAHTLPDKPREIADRFLALGPSTAKALRDQGLDPLTAKAPTPKAILDLLETHP